MHAVLGAILDNGEIDEFQESIAREMICGDARIDGITVGVIANQRGLMKAREGEKPRFGGIIYTESAEKVAYFIDRCDRWGYAAVRSGRFGVHGRDRAGQGESSRWSAVSRGHGDCAGTQARAHGQSRSGAGYYAMAGQGFDPDFILRLATGRMALMEGESAIQAVHGPTLEAAKKRELLWLQKLPRPSTRCERLEHQLDCTVCGARGYVEPSSFPGKHPRDAELALRAALHNPGPHLGPFVLPPHLGESS